MSLLQAPERRPDRAPRPERFLNRELSWLDFDRRVLELASDPSLPLLERVKLCAIVSSNLDEFFAVRLGALRSQVASGLQHASADGRTPRQTLRDARRRIMALQAAQDALWLGELQPSLAAEGIHVHDVASCPPRALESATRRWDREIRPLLTPIACDTAAWFPHVASLDLCVLVAVQQHSERRWLCLKVPNDLPSLVELAGSTFVPVESLIVHFLPSVLDGGEIETSAVFRITRDADFTVSGDADDLLEALERQLRRRNFAAPVRVEVGDTATPESVARLCRELAIDPDQVYRSAAPLGLARLLRLTAVDRPSLKEAPRKPLAQHAFHDQEPSAILGQVRRHDLLVQHPYEAFGRTVGAFVRSARDPRVGAVKATLYRTDNESHILSSLTDAAARGKQALCLLELTARFEERRNIERSHALERAGVDVVHGTPNFKVHAKLALLVRRENGAMRRYVHIGTGNYHATNATTYEDLSFFTADEEIADDVAAVFDAVTSGLEPSGFRKLLVAPWFLRDGLLREIDDVVDGARAGLPARIRIKVNALTDPALIDALYAASAAGADVEIVTRGICALRPGVPGLSERIVVRSVLGRWLEHSRAYSFEIGHHASMWIGSADLMPRNLDRRIEVLVPLKDAGLRSELAAIFDALHADTRCSWLLDADGEWTRVAAPNGDPGVSAQELLMARAAARAERGSAA